MDVDSAAFERLVEAVAHCSGQSKNVGHIPAL